MLVDVDADEDQRTREGVTWSPGYKRDAALTTHRLGHGTHKRNAGFGLRLPHPPGHDRYRRVSTDAKQVPMPLQAGPGRISTDDSLHLHIVHSTASVSRRVGEEANAAISRLRRNQCRNCNLVCIHTHGGRA